MRLTHSSRVNSAFTVKCDIAVRLFGVSNRNVFRLFILPNRSVTVPTIMDIGGCATASSKSKSRNTVDDIDLRFALHSDGDVCRLGQRISSSQYANRMFREIDFAFEQLISSPPVEIGKKVDAIIQNSRSRRKPKTLGRGGSGGATKRPAVGGTDEVAGIADGFPNTLWYSCPNPANMIGLAKKDSMLVGNTATAAAATASLTFQDFLILVVVIIVAVVARSFEGCVFQTIQLGDEFAQSMQNAIGGSFYSQYTKIEGTG
ncbi:hypothetical protein EAG_05045 [Camponotus floridanus]|uniref:Uncharacterized protein n=1 Tax=Camponotus floridanus TaxID=104421 RepID=E2A996_CAMFO|nr:hypothetical protein EAG_05045 [Camponotus floridanus]